MIHNGLAIGGGAAIASLPSSSPVMSRILLFQNSYPKNNAVLNWFGLTSVKYCVKSNPKPRLKFL